MIVSTLLGVIGAAGATVFLYWLPRSERWIRARDQRRAMVVFPISDKRFAQVERLNQILLPLGGLIVTVALLVKLVSEAV